MHMGWKVRVWWREQGSGKPGSVGEDGLFDLGVDWVIYFKGKWVGVVWIGLGIWIRVGLVGFVLFWT